MHRRGIRKKEGREGENGGKNRRNTGQERERLNIRRGEAGQQKYEEKEGRRRITKMSKEKAKRGERRAKQQERSRWW